MNYKTRNVPLTLKSLDKNGSFSGYGSVFGVADHYNDVVMPGAFARSLSAWQAKDALPPILWQHDSASPIGTYSKMNEDGKGLYVEGQLLVNDVQQAAEAYALMKAKAVTGLSIGYNVDDDGMDYDAEHGIMKLTNLDLWECSIVTFPANVQAQISDVKKICSGDDLPTLREFETLLRDAGFSRKRAESIARLGFVPMLQRDVDGTKSDDDGQSLIDSVTAAIRNHSLNI